MPESDPDVAGAIERVSALLAARLTPFVGEPLTPERQEEITKALLWELRDQLTLLNLPTVEVVAEECGPDRIAFRFEIPAWMVPEAPDSPGSHNPED